jgi:hypothetical protein
MDRLPTPGLRPHDDKTTLGPNHLAFKFHFDKRFRRRDIIPGVVVRQTRVDGFCTIEVDSHCGNKCPGTERDYPIRSPR